MKTLVFSDSHLTHRFSQRTFNYLVELFNEVDRIIINGDLWDGYLTRFDRFYNSKWNNLFPLLKKKKAIYIYGNHDRAEYSDTRVHEFSDIQVNQFELSLPGITFHIQHGHFICPTWEMRFPFIPWRWLGINYGSHGLQKLLYAYLHLPPQRLSRVMNRKMRLFAKKYLRNDTVLVCGHTHTQEKSKDGRFINTGLMTHGLAQYMIIEGNEWHLVNERY